MLEKNDRPGFSGEIRSMSFGRKPRRKNETSANGQSPAGGSGTEGTASRLPGSYVPKPSSETISGSPGSYLPRSPGGYVPKSSGGSQPRSSGDQPRSGGGQTRSGVGQPRFGSGQPKSGDVQLRSGGGQPRYGEGQPRSNYASSGGYPAARSISSTSCNTPSTGNTSKAGGNSKQYSSSNPLVDGDAASPSESCQQRLRDRNNKTKKSVSTESQDVVIESGPRDVQRTSENRENQQSRTKTGDGQKDVEKKKEDEVTPDSKSKTKNNRKSERKKQKAEVVIDRQSGYQKGSLFTRQWPKICHIFESQVASDLFEKQVSVSEKLDGSNMAISNKGYISSRRNILLNNPTPEEVSKTKFSGQKLTDVIELEPHLDTLHQRFSALFPFLETETILYGELIQTGTSTSKDDKYNYRSKGYQAGSFIAFGCGISFEENLGPDQMKMAKNHLISKGFNTQLVEDSQTGETYLVLLMNDVLKKICQQSGISKVIKTEKTTLGKALDDYCNKLKENKIEGIIVTFESQIFKWKGVEENYPEAFFNCIEDMYKVAKFTKPGSEVHVDKMRQVAIEAAKTREDKTTASKKKSPSPASVVDKTTASMKKSPSPASLENSLEAAYLSAITKFPRLEDQIDEKTTSLNKIKLKAKYVCNIKQEIIKDLKEIKVGQENSDLDKVVEKFIKVKIT